MRKFSDFNISDGDDKKIFNCNQVSITDIVNCEIEVLDYLPNVKTKHGEGRYLIHFRFQESEGKFFSNATYIKSALDQIGKEDFPFLTTIKVVKYGNAKLYKFT